MRGSKIAFIENKMPDLERVRQMLELCSKVNQWANEGPLFRQLQSQYEIHLGLVNDRTIFPCSNGGVALEAMARLHSQMVGRKLRWVASAFSFSNLGRGYFADVGFLDCDEKGGLDISELNELSEDTFDGFIVTNTHGLLQDFSQYIAFAQRTNKALLIDNAAGLNPEIPDWPWQAFSLHQTKPYGVGEGGLALIPTTAVEDFRRLLSYGSTPPDNALWLNNGKISDIACAFHLDRLAAFSTWSPAYQDQAQRVLEVAKGLGYRPLIACNGTDIATSWPLIAPATVSVEKTLNSRRVSLGKFYKPLAERPRASAIFDKLVNVPTHPDMSQLTSLDIQNELERLID